ncbi:hypothetical protein BDR04DRAFT_1119621 [Suillus decipiens]|nr:hypothetical protein BDR04DRAFT_1119621 [Suillus decipiens]
MSNKLQLDCALLGSDFRRSGWAVDATRVDNVSYLKRLLVDNKWYRSLPADALVLWKVNIKPGEKNGLGGADFDDGDALLPLTPICEVSKDAALEDENIQIVVGIRENGTSLESMTTMQIPKTASIDFLRRMIQDTIIGDPSAADACRPVLWKVSLFAGDLKKLRGHLGNLSLDRDQSLSPAALLSTIFPCSPDNEHLHIVAMQPSAPEVPIVVARRKYLQNVEATPSTTAKQNIFTTKQTESEYLCGRPHGFEDPIAVTLLDPIFAQFMDNCRRHKITTEDSRFAAKLATVMSILYPDERHRMEAFRTMPQENGISLYAAAVGATGSITDGHLMAGKFVVVIYEGKNEIGHGGVSRS